MNTAGPNPLSAVGRTEDLSLALRLNQRITAEVMQIASDHVVLAMQGVNVVARLTSSDQAALLTEHRNAQFIVRGMQGQTVTLQVAPGAEQAAQPAGTAVAADILPRLLEMAGLKPDAATLAIARALIGRNLPVTRETVEQLQKALAGVPNWGEEQAAAAATLKAAGLPVRPAAIELVSGRGLGDWVDTALSLRAQLQTLAGTRLPPELAQSVRQALDAVNRLLVRWDGDPQAIVSALKQAVQFAGHSIERALANQIQKGAVLPSAGSDGVLPEALLRGAAQQKGGDGEAALLSLIGLRRELVRAGQTQLVGELDRFLDGMRAMHFFNTEPQAAPARGQWLSIDLPVGAAGVEAGRAFASDSKMAKLRVAYRAEAEGRSIDAASTRLVIQVDMDGGEQLEVDLSVIAKTIGARVTASTTPLLAAAEAELPELEVGLQGLGYETPAPVCRIGDPTPITTMDEPLARLTLNEINVKA